MRSAAIACSIVWLCLAWVGPVRGQDAAALAKQASGSLREAQSHFFNGRLAQAEAGLAEAEAAVASLKGADPANTQVASLEQKCAKLRKDIAARKPKAAAGAAVPAAAAVSSTSDKLPSSVLFRLKEANRSLDKVERILGGVSSADYKGEASRAAVEEAKATMAGIAKDYGAQASPDAPEMREVADRISAAEARIVQFQSGAAQAAAADAQAESAEEAWLQRLNPYVMWPGNAEHNAAKYLTPSSTSDPAELAQRQSLCEEAKALLAEYEKAGVTAGGDALAEAERQLRYAVTAFEDSFKAHVQRSLEDAERRAEEIDSFLTQQEVAGAQAVLMEKSQLGELRRAIDVAAGVAGAGDARVAALRTRAGGLEARDAALRQARVEQTRMTSDRYGGGDLAALKAKAESITRDALPDAAILRATIVSAEWKEESVIEATDTTHTALRYRTTRSVTAQVAAKRSGAVQLHTLDLSQDRQSDGAWGPLYGHIMFTDAILEKNVP